MLERLGKVCGWGAHRPRVDNCRLGLMTGTWATERLFSIGRDDWPLASLSRLTMFELFQ
jgi:hypothetical protein